MPVPAQKCLRCRAWSCAVQDACREAADQQLAANEELAGLHSTLACLKADLQSERADGCTLREELAASARSADNALWQVGGC